MTIALQGVTKRFNEFTAVEAVSIDIDDGSLTSIVGPSGSGKSTLLRVIAGLERPEAGRVFLFGRDVTKLPPQKREVGFVFQHYAAFKHMTVRENVAFGLKIRRRPQQEIRSRVEELLRLVQIAGFADRYPAQLSGGQRQRMALARALAVEPKVLLLDEPFGALDARVRQDLRSWLRRLHDDVHVTTILVTHDQQEAMEISDQVIVMNHGHVQQAGNPRQVYDNPVNEFVMSFVGDANRVGDQMFRPHDLTISLEPGEGRVSGLIKRVVFLGFEVRAEVAIDQETIRVQLTRQEADRLALAPDQYVYVTLDGSRRFASADDEPATAVA